MSTTVRTPNSSQPQPESAWAAGGDTRRARFRAWAESSSGAIWLLAGIVLAGAIIRFATLNEQSFSADESFTVALSRMSFGRMLHELPITEATPPLHYLLVWFWARVFGTHEVGMRSLSALVGTLTIPAVYGVALRVSSRRAALIAAGLTCVSPILVYYSQEARAYALLVLLATVSLYYFLRVLDEPTLRLLAAWSVSAALALLTHYFAIFIVAPEAVWLIYRAAPRRPAVLATVLPALTELALAPLAYAQRNPAAGWATKYAQVDSPLATRIAKIPRELLLGFEVPLGKPLFVLLVVLCLLGGWWALRSPEARVRIGTRTLLAVAAVSFGVPIVAGLIPSLDLVFTRNFIAGTVPVLVIAAIGFSRGRGGACAAAVFAAVSFAMVLAVDINPLDQRPDIRGAVAALGPVHGTRIVIVTGETMEAALVYLHHPHTRGVIGQKLSEIDVIAMPLPNHKTAPALATIASPADGFVEVERRATPEFTILRFRAATARRVQIESLVPGYSWHGWTRAELGTPATVGGAIQYQSSGGAQ